MREGWDWGWRFAKGSSKCTTVELRRVAEGREPAVRASKAALELDLDEIDVLISDIGLPDGSGLDLMRQLRGHLKGFALSGYGTEAGIRAWHGRVPLGER